MPELNPIGITGARVIALALVKNNIRHVFLYPGGTIAPLLDELVECGVTYTCARAEQGAVFAALAAAKVSGRPQVCLVTSGPGVTNAITGVADAFYDSVPLIVLSGQVGSADINIDRRVRQTGFQETNTVNMVKGIAKVCKRLHSSDPLEETVDEIFRLVQSGRQGPAVVEMPMNIQRGEYQRPAATNVHFDFVEEDPLLTSEALCASKLDHFAKALNEAKRPIILAGNGIYAAKAVDLFRELVNTLQVPVVTSFPAVGVLPTKHPNAYSFVGFCGEHYANLALYEADFVLCLGARLDVRQIGSEATSFKHNKTLFRVDVDAREIQDGRVRADACIQADLAEFLRAFTPRVSKLNTDNWQAEIAAWRKDFDSAQFYIKETLASFHVIKEVARASAKQNVIVTSGVGTHQQMVARYFDFDFPTRRWLSSCGHGTMGYDLPAIIGAVHQSFQEGNDSNTAKYGFCFVGDGSLQMNIQELALLKELNLPIKIFVLDNKRLGIVSQFQLQNWETDHSTGNKYNPDFARIAAAYEIPSFCCEDKTELADVVGKALAHHGPVLVHCKINQKEDVLPMLLGGQALNRMFPFTD